ncbi:MAG: hypothetical protein NC200_00285 [Candidatus Gastranaerophilales bacterium]|nr:hypothetical protein [Candidatus Gastranaerophilales bacterium]
MNNISFNALSSIKLPMFKGNSVNNSQAASQDCFVRSDKKDVQMKRLNELFPNGGIDKVYDDMNKTFGIDKPAKLTFVGDNDGVVGGGFTFSKNEINLSLTDLLSDTKIVGVKDGKRTVLISPSVGLPLFVDRQLADNFVKMHSQNGNLGFDELVAEPVTDNEQRKFIIQKISHEVIHAQQHMILRRTEGIGEKEIIKAWTHKKPKNMVEQRTLNMITEKLYEQSYWAGQPETEKTIKKGTVPEAFAKTWLEAIRNYPPVDSPEYNKNAIELDAYKRSAAYAYKTCGAWN